ncbi:hypothetical protein ACET3Z_020671 [Daucus carota]
MARISLRRILRNPNPSIKDFLLLIFLLLTIFLLRLHHNRPDPLLITTDPTTTTQVQVDPTSLHHLLFSIASSSASLPKRIPYIRLWFDSNTTRAFIFLDRHLPITSPYIPPIRVSASTTSFPYTFPRGLRSAIRVARIVKEAVELNQKDVRWFVFGDDDTVFFVDNLVKVLAKYDHDKWYYVGANSESYEQNDKYAFGMGFGGGGFAISYGLGRVLARVLDSCLMRYPHLYGSDSRIYSCLAELGVHMTHEPGFHQVDVRGDLFGMLTSHPLSPLLSLHHLDAIDPIFPKMDRTRALEHLFKAVNVDPARILQQTVCYDRSNSITVSVAWGYAVQVHEANVLLPDLLPVQRTFRPWRRGKNMSSSRYMFNTRAYFRDPCNRPAVYFFNSVTPSKSGVYTDYLKHNVGVCSKPDVIQNLKSIRVFSHQQYLDPEQMKAPRRQCCSISSFSSNMLVVGIKQCGSDELISMQN